MAGIFRHRPAQQPVHAYSQLLPAPSSHTYSPSGGVSVAGAAATEFDSVDVTYTYAPSGGVIIGGGASTGVFPFTSYIGSGGILIGGHATSFTTSDSGLAERFPNLTITVVASGGYAPGSNVLNVDSSALPFNQVGSYTLAVSDPVTSFVKVLLRVFKINSSTQFSVVAEGDDVAALHGDLVTAVLSENAVAKMRRDMNRAGQTSQLPDSSISAVGDEYLANDGYAYRFDGFNWIPRATSSLMGRPTGFTPLNVGSTSLATVNNGLSMQNLASEEGVHGQEVAAPGTPWQAVAKLYGMVELTSGDEPQFGLYFRNNVGSQLETLAVTVNLDSPGMAVGVDWWNSANSLHGALAAARSFFASNDGVWLKIADDGDVKTFAISVDYGQTWIILLSENRTTTLTANLAGWFIRTNGAAKVVAAVLNSWLITQFQNLKYAPSGGVSVAGSSGSLPSPRRQIIVAGHAISNLTPRLYVTSGGVVVSGSSGARPVPFRRSALSGGGVAVGGAATTHKLP